MKTDTIYIRLDIDINNPAFDEKQFCKDLHDSVSKCLYENKYCSMAEISVKGKKHIIKDRVI